MKKPEERILRFHPLNVAVRRVLRLPVSPWMVADGTGLFRGVFTNRVHRGPG